jgi:hypothetical protein
VGALWPSSLRARLSATAQGGDNVSRLSAPHGRWREGVAYGIAPSSTPTSRLDRWCVFPGDSAETQRDCRVVDISQFGLGFWILGMAASIRLAGRVKKAPAQQGSGVRLGIELLGRTDLEQSVVKAMGRTQRPVLMEIPSFLE